MPPPPPPAQLPYGEPPQEVFNSNYPESLISEDISTSLTAYYRSGVSGYQMPKRELKDAASVSSMDSYGYSLDGYAPSLGPTQMGYPASLAGGSVTNAPYNGQVKDPNEDMTTEDYPNEDMTTEDEYGYGGDDEDTDMPTTDDEGGK